MLSLFFSSSSSFSSAPLPALLARPGNSSRARGEEAPRPSLLGPMASTEATGAGDGAEANATTTRRSDDEAFDAFDADEGDVLERSAARGDPRAEGGRGRHGAGNLELPATGVHGVFQRDAELPAAGTRNAAGLKLEGQGAKRCGVAFIAAC